MMIKLIFAKPTINNFCFVIVFFDSGRLYLDEVFFANSVKEMNEMIIENSKEIETIRYDCSVFMQDGKELREKGIDVFLYKPKQKLEERIAAHYEWLSEHLVADRDYDNENYRRFVSYISDYQQNNASQNAIAIDILSDAAKYFRRQN